MSNELPPLPQSFTILSRLQSGTEEVVSLDLVREYGKACEQAAYERAKRECLAIAYAPGYQAGKAQWIAECCAEAVGALGADK